MFVSSIDIFKSLYTNRRENRIDTLRGCSSWFFHLAINKPMTDKTQNIFIQ